MAVQAIYAVENCVDALGFYCGLTLVDPIGALQDLAAASSTDYGLYMDELDTVLSAAPATTANRYRSFFRYYDRETNSKFFPELIARNNQLSDVLGVRESQMNAVMKELVDRIVARATQSTLPMAPDPNKPDLSGPEGQVQALSTLQVGIFKQHMSNSSGAIDFDALGEAFEMFANGELRFQLPSLFWTTQPSSGYFFCFAEFATLAIDYDVSERKTWERLLPALVRAQEIFMRVYRPPDSIEKPVIIDYSGCGYRYMNTFSCSDKVALRQKYSVWTPNFMTPSFKKKIMLSKLRHRAAANAAKAFPGLAEMPLPTTN